MPSCASLHLPRHWLQSMQHVGRALRIRYGLEDRPPVPAATSSQEATTNLGNTFSRGDWMRIGCSLGHVPPFEPGAVTVPAGLQPGRAIALMTAEDLLYNRPRALAAGRRTATNAALKRPTTVQTAAEPKGRPAWAHSHIIQGSDPDQAYNLKPCVCTSVRKWPGGASPMVLRVHRGTGSNAGQRFWP